MFDLAQVDLDELVMALSDQGLGDHQWLMDPATGEIHLWSDDGGLDGDETVDGDDLDERGLREIVPIPSRSWYEIMADFADELSDDEARAELHVALHGKGAFRRFRDVVHQRHPGLIGPWRDYEEARGRLIAVDWLVSEGLVELDAAAAFVRAHSTPSVP